MTIELVNIGRIDIWLTLNYYHSYAITLKWNQDLQYIITLIKSSIVVEGIRTVVFFYERYFNYKPHKQNHLTNIQPNIYKNSHLNCPYNPP